jgi:hypothetical protein
MSTPDNTAVTNAVNDALQAAIVSQNAERREVHAQKFINHIREYKPSTIESDSGTVNDYIRLFTEIVVASQQLEADRTTTEPNEVIEKTIKSYLQIALQPQYSRIFGSNDGQGHGNKPRNLVLYILGRWLGMSPLFHTPSGRIPILLAEDSTSESEERDVDITVATLLQESQYVLKTKYGTDRPIPPQVFNVDAASQVDEALKLLESAKINRKHLDAFLLYDLADVEISWVNNICQHLMLSDEPGRRCLQVFEYPQVTQIMLPVQDDHPIAGYMNEVWRSYALLFPVDEIMRHTKYHHKWIWRERWCQCQPCDIRRRIFSDKNKSLRVAIEKKAAEEEAVSWISDDFQYLWGRIIKVKDELDKSKPTSFTALLKDHRDVAQFYGMV